ncbi:hypothetical protein BDM02DRAFT_3183260 [Thelephora ganbajun]|uniref:Uncharacterized protein n=1 Tax=Thelephora ganbajun TaxID=370292 RepID=A0ACB6ZU21_THEGA|nr:hypothetical protein BDM02DRAFT_3183260 [Thelephora ganbajun]
MARRLYLGRLPVDARSDDVAKFFDGYGRIVDVRVMTGFGFVEFENSRDAEDALNAFNGKSFMGTNIVVEFAKESRPKRDTYDADRAVRARRPPGHRLIVSGISRDTSWQDLKDFGREAGSVSFADIDRDNVGEGILEYQSREDVERAVKQLDGKELRGQTVRVAADNDRGPDNYRRDERRDDRYRDNRDRYREERPPYRRERSRSPPPRRDVDERRPRSPPRREFDDRRSSGYDRREDRRAPETFPREARDDRRRDERKREEKDDRHDDRAPRYSNGDAGYR